MRKATRIVSLLLTAVMLIGLTACSTTPDISADEMLQSGYAMLSPTGEGTKKFTLTISQGDKYHYTFSGRISDGAVMSSLTVSRNGLKSNHKDLFLLQNGNLYVNMNGAMSAAESEVGFTFTDSSALQGRYLTIDNGTAFLTDMRNHLKEKVFADWAALRTSAENTRGEYQYNLTYQGDALTKLMADMIADADAAQDDTVSKIDETIKACAGDTVSVYDNAMLYLQDLVDIDTGKISGEYVSLGTQFATSLKQELTALQTLMQREGSYITEGVSYSNQRREEFAHCIRFCDKDGKECGSITLEVAAEDVDKIDASSYQYITFADFIGVFLQNVKNTKGVGYETSDFPYVATYTASQLTLTETNDLYKCTHVFNFERNVIVDYVVTYYTYDLTMHNALRHKCEMMRMTAVSENSEGLAAGTGAGLLQYRSAGMASKYDAKDPVTLLAQLEELGVPTYGD